MHGPIGTASRRRVRVAAIVLAALVAMLTCAASAAAAAPTWRLNTKANTTVAQNGTLNIVAQMSNVGDADADATVDPITFSGTLPTGLTAVSAIVRGGTAFGWDCSGTGGLTVLCTNTTDVITMNPNGPPGSFSTIQVTVTADPTAAGTLTADFQVAGGGAAAPATTVEATTIAATPPPFGVELFDGKVTDEAGDVMSQAGGHPAEASVSINFNTLTNPNPFVGERWPVEPVKDVFVDLPLGFVGDPTSLDECTVPQLLISGKNSECPSSSQVGVVLVHFGGGLAFRPVLGPIPVFNMVPPPDVPARFGFQVSGTLVTLDARLRSDGDYGLSVDARNAPEGLPIIGTEFTFWGDPSDSIHDSQRFCPGQLIPADGGPGCHVGTAAKAFLRNPTSCGDPRVGLVTSARVDSWADPGDFTTASFASHVPPGYPAAPADRGDELGTTSCELVPFNPALSGRPQADARAGDPSGFDFDLALPQDSRPTAVGTSDLRKAVVTLPQGVRVNPSSAGGLAGCSSAQIHLRSAEFAECPNGSKLGDVSIDTPLLDDPLSGAIYLATPFDNPARTLVALYIVARGPGVMVKLPGSAQMDQATGQLTATFDDNPQLPFSNLHIHFKSGPRAPLTLPKRCGTYTTHAVMTGWNGRTVSSDSSFTLDRNAAGVGCPSKFTPRFSAGTESNGAGTSSSFVLQFTRDDVDQEISALTVNMASGLTARIANADLCSDAAANSDSCPAGSKIGDVAVGAGSGSNPFYISNGRAYLTGPYKGAPYGVAIDVPAVAGPFDLGLVTVRSALFVDKHDASVRIVSDPLPTILQGIPLDVRDVRVNVNKPDFFLNPTSCADKTISATLTSTEGATARVSDRFQAAECAGLGFKPRMVLTVGGRGHTHRNQTSPLSTTLTMPSRNQANLRFVRVTLPPTINARLNTIQDACTRAEFESEIGKCAHAKAGSAVASTPLLRAPLRGTVYFVKNGRPIPDLFVALRGQVSFDLIGRITIPGGNHLATTFDAAPDVPIRSFRLSLLGGFRTASIGAVENLCTASSRRQKAAVDYIGQNGKVLQIRQTLKVAGCAKPHKRGKGAAHRRAR